MKVIAVIGPDVHAAQSVAAQLLRCRAVVGAGPQQHPDGVLAVVGGWTAEDHKVVNAVTQAMGVVLLYQQQSEQAEASAWEAQPGVIICTTLSEVQNAVDNLVLHRQRWAADARRGDMERADRVRVAVRLEAKRVAQELLNTCDEGSEENLQELFEQHLRWALLRQGVACPSIHAQPMPQVSASTGLWWSVLVALLAGLCGGLAMGFGVGRALGQPWWGVVLGVVLALLSAGVRVALVRSAEHKALAARRAVALKESWAALTSDVLSRVQIPCVADAIGGR